MTYNEMYKKVLEIFPDAQFEEDNDGQLVIYTDTKVTHNGKIITFNVEN